MTSNQLSLNWITLLKITGFLVLINFCSCGQYAPVETRGRQKDTIQVLKNDSVSLTINLWGGTFTAFSFNNNNLNPLDWELKPIEMPENNRKGAPFRGHFLCFGRWGRPTAKESEAGIPHNGEPANQLWNLEHDSTPGILKMTFTAPLENWQIKRTVRLAGNQSCFTVEETFINPENFGRFTTVVQHSTLGGDFLTKNTIINSNAGEGFNQALIGGSLNEFEYTWPEGYSDTFRTKIDLQNSAPADGYVSTHIINDSTGWVTAATPEKNLLIGYAWKTAEYPWLHIWHGTKNGRLWAKGLEFGTTGLGDSFSPQERLTNSFKGRENYFFVDAKYLIKKHYTCFLIRISNDFLKVKNIDYSEKGIKAVVLTTKGEQQFFFGTN